MMDILLSNATGEEILLSDIMKGLGYDKVGPGLTDTSNMRKQLYLGDEVTFCVWNTTTGELDSHRGTIIFNNGEFKVGSKTNSDVAIIGAINIKKINHE